MHTAPPLAPVVMRFDTAPARLLPQNEQQQQKQHALKRDNKAQMPRNIKSKRRWSNLKQPLTKDMPRMLSELLKEPKVALLHRVVKHVGPKMSWQLLGETLRMEKNGGQSVNAEASGKPELFFVVDEVSHEYKPRRRTSGGVFFTLLKNRVSKEVYRTIYEVEDRKKKDAKKRVRSRQRQKMDNTLAKLGFNDLTLAPKGENFTAVLSGKTTGVPIAVIDEVVDVVAEDGEVAEDMQIS